MAANQDLSPMAGTMSPLVERMLGPFVVATTDLVAVATAAGTIAYVNPAGLAMLGVAPGDGAMLGSMSDLFPPDDLAYAREVVMAEFARSGRWDGNFRLYDRRLNAALPVRLELLTLQDEATDARAIGIVARDVSESRRSDVRLRFLVDAGAALSQSLDQVETFERLTDLIVASFATYCAIDVLYTSETGVGSIRRVAAAHVDRDGPEFLRNIEGFVTNASRTEHPPARAIALGSSSLVADVDEAWIERITASEPHAAFVRELGLRSLITVPLVAGGDVVGALSCGLGRETAYRPHIKRVYDAEDLFFVEEIGRRAGSALFNSRVYDRERRIADALQAASLPRSLPQSPGVRIDADYRPSSAEATIGGDWYDAVRLADGRIAISVGDVVGHGLLAAITMTKLRQAMQAAAMVDADPRTMLRVANDTILAQDSERHATALAGILDMERRTFSFACAGHPGPLLRTRDGAEEIESVGLPLGYRAQANFKTTTIDVPHDALLVIFTDGLVEATRDILVGYDKLNAALSDAAVMAAPHIARAIANSVLAGVNARDDVAVLTIRFEPTDTAIRT